MCSRAWAASRSNWVRRTMISCRCSMKCSSSSLRFITFGAPLIQGEHDDAEGGLHRGVLVELVQHDVGDGVALELDDHPHAVLVGLVVAPPLMPSIFLSLHQLGDRLDQVLLVDLVGDLGHHDLRAARRLLLLDLGAGPHDHAAAAGLVGLLDPLAAVDVARRSGSRGP